MDLKCFVALLEVLDWEIHKSIPKTPKKEKPQKIYEWEQWLKAKVFITSALHCLECVQNDGEEGE